MPHICRQLSQKPESNKLCITMCESTICCKQQEPPERIRERAQPADDHGTLILSNGTRQDVPANWLFSLQPKHRATIQRLLALFPVRHQHCEECIKVF